MFLLRLYLLSVLCESGNIWTLLICSVMKPRWRQCYEGLFSFMRNLQRQHRAYSAEKSTNSSSLLYKQQLCVHATGPATSGQHAHGVQ